jgi:acyl-CoA-binding protein
MQEKEENEKNEIMNAKKELIKLYSLFKQRKNENVKNNSK